MNSPTSTIRRLSPNELVQLVGVAEAAHLQNKTRGGANGFKGFKFEHLFGAHRIARLARKYIDTGVDAHLEWQSDGFVDDFVVRRDALRSFKGYQLKNAATVSWTSGSRTIAQDFTTQHAISSSEGYGDIRLRLVCSDPELARASHASVPAAIQPFTKAIYFPYAATALMPLLHDHRWLAEDFAYLSKSESPRTIQVSEVASVLMGAWDMLAPTASVSAVVEMARRTSPTLLRSFRSDADAQAQLTVQFRAALDRWPDFTYGIVRGFLSWSAFGGSTSGVLSFDCFSEQFAGLQRLVTNQQPRSFEDVEGAFT